MIENAALVAFFAFVFIGLLAWYRGIQRNVVELRTLREAKDAAEAEALEAAKARTAEPRICRNCVHFDHELGQKEMQRQPVFLAAASVLPPWRMGRVMKADANGKHLPLKEQDIAPAVMKTEWIDFGACPETERLISQHDTCEKFERKPVDLVPAESLVRPTVRA